MSIYGDAETRDSLEQSLKDLQWLAIETLTRRKDLLDTEREFKVLVRAGKISELTQHIFRERLRRNFRDLDEMLRMIYEQRNLARKELRKLVG